MIPVDDLVAIFRRMFDERWKYTWGAASKGNVDCSGAFVYAFGLYNYIVPHGSNAIARKKVIGEMLPIYDAKPGMAAFKLRKNDEAGYNLPDKYKPGGSEYNGDLNDYYHIGLVYTDPTLVLNAKGEKSGFCLDKLSAENGWDCVAYLWNVDYMNGKDDQKMETAKVVLPAGATGSTVRMRKGTSTKSDVIALIPVGATVNVLSDMGQWMYIEYAGKDGYMMSDYLEYGQRGENGLSAEDTEAIEQVLERLESMVTELQAAIDDIGMIVGRG